MNKLIFLLKNPQNSWFGYYNSLEKRGSETWRAIGEWEQERKQN